MGAISQWAILRKRRWVTVEVVRLFLQMLHSPSFRHYTWGMCSEMTALLEGSLGHVHNLNRNWRCMRIKCEEILSIRSETSHSNGACHHREASEVAQVAHLLIMMTCPLLDMEDMEGHLLDMESHLLDMVDMVADTDMISNRIKAGALARWLELEWLALQSAALWRMKWLTEVAMMEV